MSYTPQIVVLLCACVDIWTHIIILAAFIPDPHIQIPPFVHPLAVRDSTRTPRDNAAAVALSQARCQCADDGAVEGPAESAVGDQREACGRQRGRISSSVVQFRRFGRRWSLVNARIFKCCVEWRRRERLRESQERHL